MPFDIISIDFKNDTVTFEPKCCSHMKTISISNLLNYQGYRYCGKCFEKFGIEAYNKILQCVKDKECSLLTSKEHFMDLNLGTRSKVKIIGKCKHEYDIVYLQFKNGKGLCTSCLNEHRSKTRKEFYKENKDYNANVEINGNVLFRKYLSDEFHTVSIRNCIADMLIKPKFVIEDVWLPIQLKSTSQKDSRYTYKFVIKHNDYTNTVLVCICVSEEKFWVFEGHDIPQSDAINIFNKSESSQSQYNKFNVSKCNLSGLLKQLYMNSKINNTKAILSIPICETHKTEYKYKLIRESKFANLLQFEDPETDSSVFDFMCNGMKVQEKIGHAEKNMIDCYRVSIKKTKDGSEKMPYHEKDNDVYWFHIIDNTLFYVVPNEIMKKLKYLTTDTDPGKTALLLYPNYQVKTKGKQVISLELNDYMFDYDNIDIRRIKQLFNMS